MRDLYDRNSAVPPWFKARRNHHLTQTSSQSGIGQRRFPVINRQPTPLHENQRHEEPDFVNVVGLVHFCWSIQTDGQQDDGDRLGTQLDPASIPENESHRESEASINYGVSSINNVDIERHRTSVMRHDDESHWSPKLCTHSIGHYDVYSGKRAWRDNVKSHIDGDLVGLFEKDDHDPEWANIRDHLLFYPVSS